MTSLSMSSVRKKALVKKGGVLPNGRPKRKDQGIFYL